MVEFTKEEEIPPIEYNFKVSEEAREMAVILNSMDTGEVLRFPVSGNQPKKQQQHETGRLIGKAKTAAKLAIGRYRVTSRKGDVWVERLD